MNHDDSILGVSQTGKAFRLLLLMRTFELSLGDVAHASNGAISKTQLHRILAEKNRPRQNGKRSPVAYWHVCALDARIRRSCLTTMNEGRRPSLD